MFSRRELARFVAVGAAASFALPALAASAGIAIHRVASPNVPGEAAVAVYRPPGYDARRAEPYPLLLLLHGGNGSERDLHYFKDIFDGEILAGRLPPLVIATPSGRRSLYMDFRDGSQRWESFILSDVLPLLRRTEHVGQVVEVGDSNVVLRYLGWIDQRESDFYKTRSLAIVAVKSALEKAGFGLPEPIYRLRFDPRTTPLPFESIPEGTSAPNPSTFKSTDIDETVHEDVEPVDDIKDMVDAERAQRGDGEQDLLDHDRPVE